MNDEPHLSGPQSLEPTLQAAVKAIVAAPISEEAIERVKARAKHIAAGTEAETVHPAPPAHSLNAWSWIMRHRASAVTATAIFVLAIAGVVLWFHGGGATPAFADFLQPILDAKTVKFKMIVEMTSLPAGTTGMSAEEQKKMMQPQTFEVMELGSNRVRTEREMPDKSKRVEIWDGSQEKQLVLEPAERRAALYDCSKGQEDKTAETDDRGSTSSRSGPGEPGPVALFRGLLCDTVHKPDVRHESLGEKEIDGRRVVGFRLSVRGVVLKVWGDPNTRLPVRIESTTTLAPNLRATTSDFEFNVPLDESLFSVDPPAGYTLTVKQRQPSDDSPAGEKDLIEMFRYYGRWMGGRFPDVLDALWIDDVLSRAQWLDADLPPRTPQAERDRQYEEAGQKLQRGMEFAMLRPKDPDWHYAGRGVSIGAADTPIFWYRPKDATKYRVIHADLSVQETETPPQVPAMPVAQLEKDLIAMFRQYAGLSGDRFPDNLLFPKFVSRCLTAYPPDTLSAEQQQELPEARVKLQQGALFIGLLPKDADWHYAGKGVSFGAADRPIFWYRPKDSRKYRVIYADLSIHNADAAPEVSGGPPEQDLIDSLRCYAELSNGTFPDSLDRKNFFQYREKKFGQYVGQRPTAKQVKEAMECMLKLQPGVAFAASLPPEADAHYAGKGVVRGKVDTPIFWYRPKDAKKYRIIYADLSVHETDTPPDVANAQPVPGPSSPKQ